MELCRLLVSRLDFIFAAISKQDTCTGWNPAGCHGFDHCILLFSLRIKYDPKKEASDDLNAGTSHLALVYAKIVNNDE